MQLCHRFQASLKARKFLIFPMQFALLPEDEYIVMCRYILYFLLRTKTLEACGPRQHTKSQPTIWCECTSARSWSLIIISWHLSGNRHQAAKLILCHCWACLCYVHKTDAGMPQEGADTAFNEKPDNSEESSCFRETWVLLKHSELQRHLVFALLSVQLQVIIQPPSGLCFCSVWIEKCPNKNPCIVSGLYAWKELNKLHLEWSKWSIFLTVLLVHKGWWLKIKFYHYQC